MANYGLRSTLNGFPPGLGYDHANNQNAHYNLPASNFAPNIIIGGAGSNLNHFSHSTYPLASSPTGQSINTKAIQNYDNMSGNPTSGPLPIPTDFSNNLGAIKNNEKAINIIHVPVETGPHTVKDISLPISGDSEYKVQYSPTKTELKDNVLKSVHQAENNVEKAIVAIDGYQQNAPSSENYVYNYDIGNINKDGHGSLYLSSNNVAIKAPVMDEVLAELENTDSKLKKIQEDIVGEKNEQTRTQSTTFNTTGVQYGNLPLNTFNIANNYPQNTLPNYYPPYNNNQGISAHSHTQASASSLASTLYSNQNLLENTQPNIGYSKDYANILNIPTSTLYNTSPQHTPFKYYPNQFDVYPYPLIARANQPIWNFERHQPINIRPGSYQPPIPDYLNKYAIPNPPASFGTEQGSSLYTATNIRQNNPAYIVPLPTIAYGTSSKDIIAGYKKSDSPVATSSANAAATSASSGFPYTSTNYQPSQHTDWSYQGNKKPESIISSSATATPMIQTTNYLLSSASHQPSQYGAWNYQGNKKPNVNIPSLAIASSVSETANPSSTSYQPSAQESLIYQGNKNPNGPTASSLAKATSKSEITNSLHLPITYQPSQYGGWNYQGNKKPDGTSNLAIATSVSQTANQHPSSANYQPSKNDRWNYHGNKNSDGSISSSPTSVSQSTNLTYVNYQPSVNDGWIYQENIKNDGTSLSSPATSVSQPTNNLSSVNYQPSQYDGWNYQANKNFDATTLTSPATATSVSDTKSPESSNYQPSQYDSWNYQGNKKSDDTKSSASATSVSQITNPSYANYEPSVYDSWKYQGKKTPVDITPTVSATATSVNKITNQLVSSANYHPNQYDSWTHQGSKIPNTATSKSSAAATPLSVSTNLFSDSYQPNTYDGLKYQGNKPELSTTTSSTSSTATSTANSPSEILSLPTSTPRIFNYLPNLNENQWILNQPTNGYFPTNWKNNNQPPQNAATSAAVATSHTGNSGPQQFPINNLPQPLYGGNYPLTGNPSYNWQNYQPSYVYPLRPNIFLPNSYKNPTRFGNENYNAVSVHQNKKLNKITPTSNSTDDNGKGISDTQYIPNRDEDISNAEEASSHAQSPYIENTSLDSFIDNSHSTSSVTQSKPSGFSLSSKYELNENGPSSSAAVTTTEPTTITTTTLTATNATVADDTTSSTLATTSDSDGASNNNNQYPSFNDENPRDPLYWQNHRRHFSFNPYTVTDHKYITQPTAGSSQTNIKNKGATPNKSTNERDHTTPASIINDDTPQNHTNTDEINASKTSNVDDDTSSKHSWNEPANSFSSPFTNDDSIAPVPDEYDDTDDSNYYGNQDNEHSDIEYTSVESKVTSQGVSQTDTTKIQQISKYQPTNAVYPRKYPHKWRIRGNQPNDFQPQSTDYPIFSDNSYPTHHPVDNEQTTSLPETTSTYGWNNLNRNVLSSDVKTQTNDGTYFTTSSPTTGNFEDVDYYERSSAVAFDEYKETEENDESYATANEENPSKDTNEQFSETYQSHSEKEVKVKKTETEENVQHLSASKGETVENAEQHTSSDTVNVKEESSEVSAVKKAALFSKNTSGYSNTTKSDISGSRTLNVLLKILDSIEKIMSGN